MASQKWIRDYLYFSKRDRLGIFVLLFLIAIIYCLPFLVPGRKIMEPQEVVLLQAAIDSLARTTRDTARLHPYRKQEREGALLGALFAFDPNTATTDDWRRMGLKEKSILIIEHYRSKGGKFFKPDDLKRIWGLPPGFYERVKDSVRIEAKRPEFKRTFEPRPAKNIGLVIINEADSLAWMALPGIGSRLSERIIHYRDKLGGFYSVEQIKETYGISDSLFQLILPYLRPGGSLRKIHINTATPDELKAHPYIRWKLAASIVAYRNQHGPFQSLEELKNIILLDEATYQKILPYLEL